LDRFLAAQQSQVTALANVNNQGLVSLPWWADYGALLYRSDILQRSGVSVPRTWDDIENGCNRIVATQGNQTGSCFATTFAGEY
jgi:ABC-type glycerol-3-phosphate transport system substrate-binding protein